MSKDDLQYHLTWDSTKKSDLDNVMREGTFSATYADVTYMGVRFNRDRVFLLARMLKAKTIRDSDRNFLLSFQSIPREKEPMSRFTLKQHEWYVVDMEGRIYIMSDDDVKNLEKAKPLSFDWHMYDLFPRVLEMNREYNDSRYEVEKE